MRWSMLHAGVNANLLRVLGDQEDEREIIHPQRSIKELVRIYQENDVLDRFLNEIGVCVCKC